MAKKKRLVGIVLGIFGIVVVLMLGYFVFSLGNEPQDVLLHGMTPETEHYLDGKLVGKGLLVCVPKVSQGKHAIEQRTAGQTRKVTAEVGDVGIRIVNATAQAENIVVLSNCSKQL